MIDEKYRIIERSSKNHTSYKVQKRLLFGIWYNFNNIDDIDACITGVYNTEKEAREAIEVHKQGVTLKIIDIEN